MIIKIDNVNITLTKEQKALLCKAKPKMFPQKDEKYWAYHVDGKIYTSEACDTEGRINVYKTNYEARIAVIIAFAKSRVKHAIEIANDGWVPDWNEEQQTKYNFYFSNEKDIFIGAWSKFKYQPIWLYMKSKKVAKRILKEHEEDLVLIFSE